MEGGEATRVLGVEKHADEGASGHRFLKWVVRHPSWACGGRAQSVDLTGESHRINLMRKLDIHETATLVRYAIRRGLTAV